MPLRGKIAVALFIAGPPIAYFSIGYGLSFWMQSHLALWLTGTFGVLWLLGIGWAAFYPLPQQGELSD